MIPTDALFRYQIVSMVLTRMRSGESRAEAVRTVAAMTHHLSAGCFRRVSTRSIYRWLAAYEEAGILGLVTAAAQLPEPSSGVISPKLIAFFRKQKAADPKVSIPEMIRRAEKAGHLKITRPLHRVTVYRALKKVGISVRRRKSGKDRDARRFAYPHRMDMVICDGKHFRAGITRARRVALFFLDDATRYGLHVVVGTSENAQLFQRGLYETIAKYGYCEAAYVDKGPGFIADDTIEVVANLDGMLLIHGEAGYPQGRGKVERFNRTAGQDLLRGLDQRPDVDPDLRSLELRLQHYLETQYNPRVHESLQGESPAQRFFRDEKPLRLPESLEALRRQFEVHVERRVSADNVVSLGSVAYEVPRGYDGVKIVLRRRVLDGGKIFFLHEGRLIELHPVDLEANARARRAKATTGDDDEVEHPLPPSAADLDFQRDLGPVVSPDDEDPDLPDPDPSQEETP